MTYPGYLHQGFEPFDPIALARLTEAKVGRGLSRKYTDFYCVGVYGGISTGYTIGCCLHGIPLGHDDSYAQELAGYRDVYLRVSLKAGTAEGFQEGDLLI
ncbi:MAG: hypothetical protein FJ014_17575 [Chloroflexi bacterium]|nr:hypothetical protein [Chloroflexota bacterium]